MYILYMYVYYIYYICNMNILYIIFYVYVYNKLHVWQCMVTSCSYSFLPKNHSIGKKKHGKNNQPIGTEFLGTGFVDPTLFSFSGFVGPQFPSLTKMI